MLFIVLCLWCSVSWKKLPSLYCKVINNPDGKEHLCRILQSDKHPHMHCSTWHFPVEQDWRVIWSNNLIPHLDDLVNSSKFFPKISWVLMYISCGYFKHNRASYLIGVNFDARLGSLYIDEKLRNIIQVPAY